MIDAILADHRLPPARTGLADGVMQGYVVDEPGSARGALEPLVDLYAIAAIERADGLEFRTARAAVAPVVAVTDFVVEAEGPTIQRERTPDHELPAEAVLLFRDHLADFQSSTARVVREGAAGRRQHAIGFPGVLEREHGRALAAAWLDRVWSERETVSFAVPPQEPAVEAGAIVRSAELGVGDYLVSEVEVGLVRRVSARRIDRSAPPPWFAIPADTSPVQVIHAGLPHAVFLDLPARSTGAPSEEQFRVAAWKKPWRRQVVLASPGATGFETRTVVASPADVGVLAEALPPGSFSGRIDRGAAIVADLFDAETQSVTRAGLLNGANALAVRSSVGVWEIVQFESAEETAPGRWRLWSLLRGQLGTEDAMTAGAPAGADVVILDARVVPCGLRSGEAGLLLNWKVGPAGSSVTPETFVTASLAGGVRAMIPLAPVHLRMRRSAGDLHFSWKRRGRLDADGWDPTEIPLGEEAEVYSLEVALPGGDAVRTATTTQPAWTYAAADIAADFGTMPAELDFTVRQEGRLTGLPATRRFVT